MPITAATLDYLVKAVQLIGIPVGIIVYGINKKDRKSVV